MDSPKKLDVDWEGTAQPVIASNRVPPRFLPPTLIGILGTLLLHVMFIQSVAFASRGPKPKPAMDSVSSLSKSTADTDDLTLVSLPTITNAIQANTDAVISSIPDLSKMKIESTISADPPTALNLETLVLSENQASSPISGRADGAELARLFGLYTGQIRARIDRVWRRPRTPIHEDSSGDTSDSFRCEAQIVQDGKGNVQEILLVRCNGSPAWQHSLVVAIQQASPLPAPPSTEVFTQSITLNFVGLPYVDGASNEEYEIALARVDQ